MTVLFVCIMLRQDLKLLACSPFLCNLQVAWFIEILPDPVLASIGFANDANRLVLYPVENMIAKVEFFDFSSLRLLCDCIRTFQKGQL